MIREDRIYIDTAAGTAELWVRADWASHTATAIPYRRKPLPHHVAGLQYTRSGYGRKIPTVHQVRLGNRWRRVYVCCFSNAGTAYIDTPTGWLCVDG